MKRRQLIQMLLGGAGSALVGCHAPVRLIGDVDEAIEASRPNTAVPPLKYFDPPAMQNDFGSDKKAYQQFVEAWSKSIDRWTEQAIFGDPNSVLFDHGRSGYFNPLKVGIPPDAPIAPIYWRAFPNRPLVLFGQNPDGSKNLNRQQILELVDTGSVVIDGQRRNIADIQIPGDLCPQIDWSGPLAPYYPPGPRGWQDEYCEWAVRRNADGKITKVMITCENPEYWFALWRQDPLLVRDLYRQYVNTQVELEDLYLRHDGQVVIDPTTGCPMYDAVNKWNRGPHLRPDSGGAMHLTSTPNSLPAEIYIAAAATLTRTHDHPVRAEQLICCSQYGQPHRGSDPHIGLVGNELASKGLQITLTNPVGLYIRDPHFDGYELPKNAPKSSPPPAAFWRVERGKAGGQTLHAVFEVPDELPFEVGDLTIFGEPIRWGGQIVETFRIVLYAAAVPAIRLGLSQACIVERPPDVAQPWPRQLLGLAAFEAASPIRIAPRVRQGTTVRNLVLVVDGGRPGARLDFSGTGLSATVTRFIPKVGHMVPGDDRPLPAQAYVFDLTVNASAETGDRGIRAVNPGGDPPAPTLTPGFLEVIAANDTGANCNV